MPPPIPMSSSGFMPGAAAAPDQSAAIDLGYIPSYMQEDYEREMSRGDKGGKAPVPPSPQYPSLNIEGAPATSLMAADLEPGSTITATITLRVVGIRKRAARNGGPSSVGSGNGDNNVELEATSITIQDQGQEEDESADLGAGAAMDAFRSSRDAGGDPEE